MVGRPDQRVGDPLWFQWYSQPWHALVADRIHHVLVASAQTAAVLDGVRRDEVRRFGPAMPERCAGARLVQRLHVNGCAATNQPARVAAARASVSDGKCGVLSS